MSPDEIPLRVLGRDPAQRPCFLGRVFADPTVPTSTDKYFHVHPVIVTGNEAEGASATRAVDATRVVPVFVIGTKAPVAGDDLLCRLVGHRWVAQKLAGPDGVSLAGCPCTVIPSTLTVDVVSQTFLTHYADGTLIWRAVPEDVAALHPESPAFWSDVIDYPDGFGTQYRWTLRCESGFYRLVAVVMAQTSPPFPVPYESLVTTYVVPHSGNSCSPFTLTSGSNANGVDVDVTS